MKSRATTYRVQVTDPQGKVLKHCGHEHKTPDDAARCLRNVCSFDDGTLKPTWQGAEVRGADGSLPPKTPQSHDMAGAEIFELGTR